MGFFSGLSDFLLMRRAQEDRVAKRAVHSAVSKTKGRRKWRWDSLTCQANTKSEARARFKQATGKRLPIGANIVCVSEPKKERAP